MSAYPLVLPRAIFPNNPKQKVATHCWVSEPFGERDPLTREKKISAKVAIEGSTLAAKWMLNSYLTRYQKSENTRMQKNVVYSLLKTSLRSNTFQNISYYYVYIYITKYINP